MNLIMHLGLFLILATCLIAVYVYRHWLENHEDHYIHLHNDAHDQSVIASQSTIGKRLEALDKVKTGLLAATIAYALVIAAMAVVWAWHSSATATN